MANDFLFMLTNCLCEPDYRRTQNLLIDDDAIGQDREVFCPLKKLKIDAE